MADRKMLIKLAVDKTKSIIQIEKDINEIQKKIQTGLNIKVNTSDAKKNIKELTNITKQTNLTNSIVTWMDKNTKATRKSKEELQSYLNILQKGNVQIGTLKEIELHFKQIQIQERQLGNLGKNFVDSISDQAGKFTQWVTVSGAIMAVFQQLKNGTQFVKELDDALTNVSFTTDISNKSLKDLGDSAIDMADDLNTSANKVLEAVTVYANANETAESILKKTEPAVMLSNVSGMEVNNVVDVLQGAMEQFDMTEDELMHISDLFQSVSAEMPMDFAKGIKELSEGIQTSGEIAKQSGYSIEQYTALLGTLISKTRQSGSELGRSVRTMMLRTTKASTSALASGEVTQEDLSNAEKALRRVGIEVRSDVNTFKDFDQILSEIYAKIDTLSDVDISNIAYETAGIRQANTFKVMIKSYGEYQQMIQNISDMEGTTLANQEKYAESLTGHLNDLSNSWQKLYSDAIDSEVLKLLVDFLTTLVDLLDKLVEGTGELGLIVSTTLGGSLIKNIILELQTMPSTILATEGAIGALKTGIKGIASTTLSSPIAQFSLLTLTAIGGYKAIKYAYDTYINQSFDNLDNRLKKTNESYDEHISKMEDALSSMEDILQQINENNEEKLSITDPVDIERLEIENKQLQEQYNILKTISDEQAKQAENDAVKASQTTFASKFDTSSTWNDSTNTWDVSRNEDIYVTQQQELDRVLKQYREYEKGLSSLSGDAKDEMVLYMGELKTYASELALNLYNQADKIDGVTEAGKKQKESIQETLELYSDWIGTGNNVADVEEKITEIADVKVGTFDSYIDELKTIEESYQTLVSAEEELAENGSLSAKTYKEIVDSGLSQYIEEVNGKLTINTDKLFNSAESTKELALQSLKASMSNDILAISLGETENVSDLAKGVITELGDSMEETGDKASESVTDINSFAVACQNAMDGAMGNLHGNSDTTAIIKKRMDAVVEAYKNVASQIDNVSLTKSKNNSSSSQKDTWLEEYKEKQSILDDQLNSEYITQAEHYEKSNTLYNNYLKGREKYSEESAEAEKKLHDNWTKVFEEEKKTIEQMYKNGQITAIQYYSALSKLGEKYYSAKENAETYGEYLEELKDIQQEVSDGMKDAFEDAINGVSTILDMKIDDLQYAEEKITKELNKQVKAIDKQIKEYEKQKDALENQKKNLESQKKLIEKQKEALSDQKSDIEDQTEERQRQLNLEEALMKLHQAESQRTKMSFVNGQWTYTTDDTAIKSAREDVQSAQEEIEKAEIDKQIKALEKEIDSIDDAIDKVDEAIDSIDDLIQNLNYQKDEIEELISAQEEYYDEMIQNIQEYQRQWERLIKEQEKQDIVELLGTLGTTEEDILSGSANAFDSIKKSYNGLIKNLKEGNDDLLSQFGDLNSLDTAKFVSTVKSANSAVDDFNKSSTESLEKAVDSANNLLLGNTDEEGKDDKSNSFSGAFTVGTENVLTTLNDGFLPCFDEFKNNLFVQMQSIIDYANQMADSIVESCNRAMEAIASLANANSGSSYSYSGSGYANGTNGALTHSENNSIVAELVPELVVDTNNGTYQLYTSPSLVDLPSGAIVFNGEQTQRILKNKKTSIGGASFANGTYQTVTPSFSNSFDASNLINGLGNNSVDNTSSISIGDVYVSGVNNAEQFAEEIVRKLPNIMIQKLNRRN